jgi:glucosamine 6-phosphate synthetase-like amidotransferase/phosphosugar isomerase protein
LKQAAWCSTSRCLLSLASTTAIPVKKKQFVLQSGLLSSALEHAVPEQLFVNAQNPGEAISAVKALQKASAAGQRIYQITPANQSTILANIHHDSDTMAEIRNALNAGKEVITHTDAVSKVA